MADSLRTQHPDPGPTAEAHRAARIEQLLLAGLDQYFAGHYEQAIDTWTRVSFVERGHGRARAYIERARSALAERQRESEQSLHDGVAAYESGDLRAARQLLTRAVEQGGATDTALVFLQRLGRLDAATAATRPDQLPSPRLRPRTVAAGPRGARTKWVLTAGASVAVATLIVLAALPVASWLRESTLSAPVGERGPEVLPVVRGSEARLRRAQGLIEAGRPHEALRLLEGVAAGDPLRSDADRLRTNVQRQLLGDDDTAVPVGAPER